MKGKLEMWINMGEWKKPFLNVPSVARAFGRKKIWTNIEELIPQRNGLNATSVGSVLTTKEI